MRSREAILEELAVNMKYIGPAVGQEFILLEILRAILDCRDLLESLTPKDK